MSKENIAIKEKYHVQLENILSEYMIFTIINWVNWSYTSSIYIQTNPSFLCTYTLFFMYPLYCCLSATNKLLSIALSYKTLVLANAVNWISLYLRFCQSCSATSYALSYFLYSLSSFKSIILIEGPMTAVFKFKAHF